MFCRPAWAVASCSSGLLASRTVGTKYTGGCCRPELSPCTLSIKYHTENDPDGEDDDERPPPAEAGAAPVRQSVCYKILISTFGIGRIR